MRNEDTPSFYISKPVKIEAVRTFPEEMGSKDCEEQLRSIVRWVMNNGGEVDSYDGTSFEIVTLEGKMRVNPGDWVIRGTVGEFYPCRDDVFTAKYAPMTVQR